MNPVTDPTPFTKMNSRRITELNVKKDSKNYKTPRE